VALKAKVVGLAGWIVRGEHHEPIHTTNRAVKGVMAMDTGSYIIGIRMIRILHYI
jgi:hypothetical protein